MSNLLKTERAGNAATTDAEIDSLCKSLLSYRQIDEDGTDCGVSREAVHQAEATIRALRFALTAAEKQAVEERRQFANFFRNLCKRFAYCFDEVDWKRDQCSIEEHIAGRLTAAEKDLARMQYMEDEPVHVEVHQSALADTGDYSVCIAVVERHQDEHHNKVLGTGSTWRDAIDNAIGAS